MIVPVRGIAGTAAGPGDRLPEVATLAALSTLVAERPGMFVRWSKSPDHDGDERSTDYATGLTLPGLAVSPLTPPTWWTLPVDDWVARQVRAYAHLADDQPDKLAWVLTGRIVERGPDNEPLVVDVEPVARLRVSVLHEAAAREPRSSREGDES
jgi:hypothetical protein